ncbi:hypothetical protein GCM10007884_22080 [Methylobacterium brachythecii]|uniref:Uncharacterized protein n=1 Tax=Methylobacterium brachythecii TaxID=1176177 RepID=A0ABQ6D3G6_9HYPH|nr:hypothetical protein GCM10007884_22080 [Methylobacterium brachythecii]
MNEQPLKRTATLGTSRMLTSTVALATPKERRQSQQFRIVLRVVAEALSKLTRCQFNVARARRRALLLALDPTRTIVAVAAATLQQGTQDTSLHTLSGTMGIVAHQPQARARGQMTF